MPNVLVDLEQLQTDTRSPELAFRLRFTNNDTTTASILEAAPRVPEGAMLLEVQDSVHETVLARRKRLMEELTRLLDNHLSVHSEAYRSKIYEIASVTGEAFFREFKGGPFNFWSMLRFMLRRRLPALIKDSLSKSRAFVFEVHTVRDGERAYEVLLEASEVPETKMVRSIFAEKLEQLKSLAASQGSSDAFADVDPGSQFEVTYVVRARQSLFNPRRFRMVVDLGYELRGKPERYNQSVSRDFVVSPSNFVLTVVAVVGSVLGTILKYALAWATIAPQGSLAASVGPTLISSAILALVTFSIIEQTDLAAKVQFGFSWRLALALGVGAGVFSDRFLAAFKAFLGIGGAG